jgi:hypothetical protein
MGHLEVILARIQVWLTRLHFVSSWPGSEIIANFKVKLDHSMALRLIFYVLFISNLGPVFAQQDSIVLLNGRVFRGTVISFLNDTLRYTDSESLPGDLPFEITAERIFSFVVNGNESVVYKQDELKGDFLTIEEARFATLGSYDARKTFKPRFVFWSSMVLGYGLSLLDTYYSQQSYNQFVAENGIPPTGVAVGFFGTGPTLMPILSPLVLSTAWGLPSFKIKEKQVLQKDLFGNEIYYRGFHRVAKQKRVFAAVRGSVIGIGLGMISYAVFSPN